MRFAAILSLSIFVSFSLLAFLYAFFIQPPFDGDKLNQDISTQYNICKDYIWQPHDFSDDKYQDYKIIELDRINTKQSRKKIENYESQFHIILTFFHDKKRSDCKIEYKEEYKIILLVEQGIFSRFF